jgi:hypothetical protein
VLSDSHILITLNDEETSLTSTQVLSQQNQWLQFQLLGTPSRNTPLSIPNFNSLVMVEYQVDPVYDVWRPLSIVNRVDITEAEAEGRYVCAISGTPPVLSFSFAPSIMFPAYPFRIWYETYPTDDQPQNTPRLNPMFFNLLKYRVALTCREVFMGLPPIQVLHDAVARFQEQYDEYANRSPEQRAQMKPAAYETESILQAYEPTFWV